MAIRADVHFLGSACEGLAWHGSCLRSRRALCTNVIDAVVRPVNASQTSIVIVVMVLAAALGLGSYTFAYARGWAYMTDDPRACANCHVMNEQYDGWIKEQPPLRRRVQ